MAYGKRSVPKMRHRHRPPPRITRMTRGWGYLCPRCRDVIMYDRVDERYFCWHEKDCGFSETKADYATTLKDIRTTLSRADAINEVARCKAMAQRRKIRDDNTGVVYYIRFRDTIKIGTSQSPQKRFNSLPWDEILAMEPGTYEREHYRHLQFKSARLHREWFEMTDPLMAHIAEVREKNADWVQLCFDGTPPLPWTHGEVSIPGFAI